jgi:biopolymer transport protein ExbD
MGGGGGGSEGEPEFQIAPIIDVLLTLLVFFMSITTSQVEAVDRSITLPVAPDANERKPEPNQAIINIAWDNKEQKSKISFKGKPYEEMEDLNTALEGEKAAKPGITLLIRADQMLPAKEVQKVMQASAMAGIDKIGYSTHNH